MPHGLNEWLSDKQLSLSLVKTCIIINLSVVPRAYSCLRLRRRDNFKVYSVENKCKQNWTWWFNPNQPHAHQSFLEGNKFLCRPNKSQLHAYPFVFSPNTGKWWVWLSAVKLSSLTVADKLGSPSWSVNHVHCSFVLQYVKLVKTLHGAQKVISFEHLLRPSSNEI